MHNWGVISIKRSVMKDEGALWFWEVIARYHLEQYEGELHELMTERERALFHACRSTVFSALGNNCRSKSIPGERVLIASRVL